MFTVSIKFNEDRPWDHSEFVSTKTRSQTFYLVKNIDVLNGYLWLNEKYNQTSIPLHWIDKCFVTNN